MIKYNVQQGTEVLGRVGGVALPRTGDILVGFSGKWVVTRAAHVIDEGPGKDRIAHVVVYVDRLPG